jgi:hypothetical protein
VFSESVVVVVVVVDDDDGDDELDGVRGEDLSGDARRGDVDDADDPAG